jgi:hypothetical protein
MSTNTTTREAGNLYVNDRIILPNDIVATITKVDAIGLDTGTITTFMGTMTVRFTDLFTVINDRFAS